MFASVGITCGWWFSCLCFLGMSRALNNSTCRMFWFSGIGRHIECCLWDGELLILSLPSLLTLFWSMFGQTTWPKTIRDVHLWGQNIKQQQPHNNHNFKCLYSMFANYQFCVVCDLVYAIMAIEIFQNSCINPNILKS